MPWLQALLRVALRSRVGPLALPLRRLVTWQTLAYQPDQLVVVTQHLAR